jgi:hypothetical protein
MRHRVTTQRRADQNPPSLLSIMAGHNQRASGGDQVIKDLMRHADIRTTFNEYGNGLPAPMREAKQQSGADGFEISGRYWTVSIPPTH